MSRSPPPSRLPAFFSTASLACRPAPCISQSTGCHWGFFRVTYLENILCHENNLSRSSCCRSHWGNFIKLLIKVLMLSFCIAQNTRADEFSDERCIHPVLVACKSPDLATTRLLHLLSILTNREYLHQHGFILWFLYLFVSPGGKEFLTAVLKHEVENLPRGLGPSKADAKTASSRQRRDHRALHNIPGVLLGEFEQCKQPALLPHLAGETKNNEERNAILGDLLSQRNNWTQWVL